MDGTSAFRPRVLAAALFVAAAAIGPARSAAGEKQFVVIESHNPQAFLQAVRAGSDFVKSGRGKRFRVIFANAGVIATIPGMALMQRQLPPLLKGASGLEMIACRETMAALEKANRRVIPLYPGVRRAPCANIRNRMLVDGWEPAPGLML